jgi:hypothetical protein
MGPDCWAADHIEATFGLEAEVRRLTTNESCRPEPRYIIGERRLFRGLKIAALKMNITKYCSLRYAPLTDTEMLSDSR